MSKYELSEPINLILTQNQHTTLLSYSGEKDDRIVNAEYSAKNSFYNEKNLVVTTKPFLSFILLSDLGLKILNFISFNAINSNEANQYLFQYHYLLNLKEYLKNSIFLFKNSNLVIKDQELSELKKEIERISSLFLERINLMNNKISFMKTRSSSDKFSVFVSKLVFFYTGELDYFDLLNDSTNINSLRLTIEAFPLMLHLFLLVSKFHPDSEISLFEKSQNLFDLYVFFLSR